MQAARVTADRSRRLRPERMAAGVIFYGDPASEETEMVTRRPSEEIARLGDEIYERDIQHEVEAEHHGEVVAIDVESATWTIGGT